MQGGTFHVSGTASWVGVVRTAFDRWTEGGLERQSQVFVPIRRVGGSQRTGFV